MDQLLDVMKDVVDILASHDSRLFLHDVVVIMLGFVSLVHSAVLIYLFWRK